MGLFSRKKKEQTQENLPPLKFPELPSMPGMEQKPAQPEMKEAAAIKHAVTTQEKPAARMPSMPAAAPTHAAPMQPAQEPHEHPLFIKVDTYNEVLDTLSTIKAKLADANHILEEMSRLKEEEDKELTAWHTDLAAIKEKLMMVDEKLSEQ